MRRIQRGDLNYGVIETPDMPLDGNGRPCIALVEHPLEVIWVWTGVDKDRQDAALDEAAEVGAQELQSGAALSGVRS